MGDLPGENERLLGENDRLVKRLDMREEELLECKKDARRRVIRM